MSGILVPAELVPAEVTVSNLKCQVRAMRLTLDRFLGKHVPVIHPLIAWLVEHSAVVRMTAVVGRDGRTAYNNIRGTEHTPRLPFFGERLRYKGRSRQCGVASESIRRCDAIFCWDSSQDLSVSCL